MTAEEVKSSHYVGALETGEEALFTRIHLIRTARHSIDIQTFIWANDESGRYVVYELLEAARRGVKVRVLIDGWVCLGDPCLLAFMGQLHENFAVKHYNPASKCIDPSTIILLSAALTDFDITNHRMHTKSFIVDNDAVIVGGRNYQNDYFDRGETRIFRDREIIVFGPKVHEAKRYFENYWTCAMAVPPQSLKDYADIISSKNQKYSDRASFELGNLFDELDAKSSDSDFISNYFSEILVRTDDVQYVCDPPCLQNDQLNPSLQSMVAFFAQAQSELLLQTPYFVLDKPHFDAINELRKNIPAIHIRVSTNSLASTDNVFAYAHSFRERLRYLVELTLEVFELKPYPENRAAMLGFHRPLQAADNMPSTLKPAPICCHAKTFIGDELHSWIGSANVDPRSAWLNAENAFIVTNGEFARRVAATIRHDISAANSWTVGVAQNAPALAALREILHSILPENSFSEQTFMFQDNFTKREGKRELPFFHPDFYQHYESVGSFPEVEGTSREIQVRLISLLPEGTKRLV